MNVCIYHKLYTVIPIFWPLRFLDFPLLSLQIHFPASLRPKGRLINKGTKQQRTITQAPLGATPGWKENRGEVNGITSDNLW